MLKLLSIFFLSFCFNILGNEGFWRPYHAPDLERGYSEMSQLGINIPLDAIYSTKRTNKLSAIVAIRNKDSFSPFCTGSFVSSTGLILTSYHCLLNEFKLNPNLASDILEGYPNLNSNHEIKMETISILVFQIAKNISHMSEEEVADLKRTYQDPSFVTFIQTSPPFRDTYFFLFKYVNDIRLVAVPSLELSNLKNEGYRKWPQNKADFALLRAYQNTGKPFKPLIFLKTVQTMPEERELNILLGFPGSTSRFKSSLAAQAQRDVILPTKIALSSLELELSSKNSLPIFPVDHLYQTLDQKLFSYLSDASWLKNKIIKEQKNLSTKTLDAYQSFKSNFKKNEETYLLSLLALPSKKKTPLEKFSTSLRMWFLQNQISPLDFIEFQNRNMEKNSFLNFLNQIDLKPYDFYSERDLTLLQILLQQMEPTIDPAIFEQSIFTSFERWRSFYNAVLWDEKNIDDLIHDPGYQHLAQMLPHFEKINIPLQQKRIVIENEFTEKNPPYAEADGTLRFTFGHLTPNIPTQLDLKGKKATLNFLSTVDNFSGFSGGPLLNADGHMFGICFDSTSVNNGFIYLENESSVCLHMSSIYLILENFAGKEILSELSQ
ncbi:MAG: S46 family peptidase [Bacteriovoracaceae bacterium]|nr:S46 family peptidase [Bacteriovoracaceae bacterium]